MESQRDKTIAELIKQAGGDLADMAQWPESESAKHDAETAMKVLRKTFKADNYPRVFLHLAMIQIASDLLNESMMRKCPTEGLKAAWIALAELWTGNKPA